MISNIFLSLYPAAKKLDTSSVVGLPLDINNCFVNNESVWSLLSEIATPGLIALVTSSGTNAHFIGYKTMCSHTIVALILIAQS